MSRVIHTKRVTNSVSSVGAAVRKESDRGFMPIKRNSAISQGPVGRPINLVKGERVIVTGAAEIGARG